MKKVLIGVFLAALTLSFNTQADNKTIVNISSLAGLSHIVGNGRTSFGVHFNRGFYDYRGVRYSSRSAYLRAVANFERQRLLSQKQISSKGFSGNTVVISNNSFGIKSSGFRSQSAICY